MEAKELKERCMGISAVFDDLEHNNCSLKEARGIGEFHNFFHRLIFEDELKSELKIDFGENVVDMVGEVLLDSYDIVFAFGYVVGQTLDIPYSSIQQHIEAIRAVIKEEKLLPYFPRQEKGG